MKTVMKSAGVALGALWLNCQFIPTHSHPLCIDFSFPKAYSGNFSICTAFNSKEVCIDPANENAEIQGQIDNWGIPADEASCIEEMTTMACAKVDGWTGHTFDGEIGTPKVVPILCEEYAKRLYAACRNVTMAANPFLSTANSVEEFAAKPGAINISYAEEEGFLSAYAREGYCVSESPYQVQPPGDFQATSKLCIEKVDDGNFLNIAPIPGSPGYMAMGTQAGVVDVYKFNGQGKSISKVGSLIDISAKVENDGEKGFLGMAFHKNFASNGRVFLSYSCRSGQGCGGGGDTIIEEFSVPENHRGTPESMDGSVVESSWKTVFTMDQPQANHNGGQVLFSPSNNDPHLYFMSGDGGGAGDRDNNAQDLTNLLGKIVRIDVDSSPTKQGYAIPTDNPDLGEEALPEIWALGLRNPWRCAFDVENPSYFFCGDVGQNKQEEVDLIVKGGNYGWRHREGTEGYDSSAAAGPKPFIEPILSYKHNGGQASITGGYRYRGGAIPSLNGKYIYADLYGKFFVAEELPLNSGNFETGQSAIECHEGSPLPCEDGQRFITTFAEDENNEVFFTSAQGLHRIVKCDDDTGNGPPAVEGVGARSSVNLLVQLASVVLVSVSLFFMY